MSKDLLALRKLKLSEKSPKTATAAKSPITTQPSPPKFLPPPSKFTVRLSATDHEILHRLKTELLRLGHPPQTTLIVRSALRCLAKLGENEINDLAYQIRSEEEATA